MEETALPNGYPMQMVPSAGENYMGGAVWKETVFQSSRPQTIQGFITNVLYCALKCCVQLFYQGVGTVKILGTSL